MLDPQQEAVVQGVLDAVADMLAKERASVAKTVADLEGRLAAIGSATQAMEDAARAERVQAREAVLAVRETGLSALSDVAARAAAIRDGKDGAAGEPGPPGETGPAGPPGVNPAGGWERGAAYAPRDMVGWNDTSWIARETTTDEPGTSAAWQLVVRQPRPGKPGPPGKQGPPGEPAPRLLDVAIRNGSIHFIDDSGGVVSCSLDQLFAEVRAFIGRELA
jgi:hypothetical protein